MKKFLMICLIFALALVLVSCFDGLELNTKETTAKEGSVNKPIVNETTPAPGKVIVPFSIYYQDPESGEYFLQEESSGTVTLPENASYDPGFTPPTHYELNEELSITKIDKATADSEIKYYFKCQVCRAVFSAGEDATLAEGSAYQILRKGQTPTPPVFTRFGYTLTGYDNEIEPIYEDTTFTASWEISRYTLRLYATEDTDIADPTFARNNTLTNCFEKTFTVADSFSLPTPKSLGYTFLSWKERPDGNGDAVTALAQGTDHDVELYAIYNVTLYAIDFSPVEGVSFPALYQPYGTKVSPPRIAPEDQKAGYGLNWYEDQACTKRYKFTEMPAKSLTLYGKWEIETGSGFLSFDLEHLENETIDSFDELIAFVDYIRFYDIQVLTEMEVTYDDYEKVMEDLKQCEYIGHFRANGAISYTTKTVTAYQHPNTQCVVAVKVSSSYRDKEASLSTAPNAVKPYEYLVADVAGRGASYRSFYIDSLLNSFSVTTTNQLLYVVEHGYRPVPVAGSPAEKAYNEAKALLNRILPLNATDYEKVELIYNYLVMNVQYDHNAVTIATQDPDTWPLYDAYFIEGVFNKNKAVCDGIAKTFSLLCNMEGIPAVEVIGNGHAWNRVKLNNCWYVADPTFGNIQIKSDNRSIMDHGQFLISDSEKAAMGYSSLSYSHIKATESYNYFANKKLSVAGKTFDFEINSVDELALMLRYLATLKNDLNNTSIDFVFAIRGTSFSDAYGQAIQRLKAQGVRFRYGCISFSEDSIYRIIFDAE